MITSDIAAINPNGNLWSRKIRQVSAASLLTALAVALDPNRSDGVQSLHRQLNADLTIGPTGSGRRLTKKISLHVYWVHVGCVISELVGLGVLLSLLHATHGWSGRLTSDQAMHTIVDDGRLGKFISAAS